MWDKAFDKCVLEIFYIPDWYKTQEICDRIIFDYPFSLRSLRYVPDQYNTQEMCNKAVGDCLAVLKFAPDWLVTNKMIKILFTAFYAGANILYFLIDYRFW